jgi:MFS family permease
MRLPAALAVLREREFRLLYAGQTVSVVGDGVLIVALAFAVLDLTGSVSDLGFVLAASRAPLLFTVLAGGVVADRFPRRPLMVGADLIRMGAQASSAALLITGQAHLWELLALQASGGTAAGFFYPAATGLLPLTVPRALLQQANALRGLSDSAGRIVGPALGGLLVVAAGPGWALGADAASFGVSAASLALLRLPAHVPPVPQHFLRDLADGWNEFRSRTWVWATVVVAGALGNLFTAFLTALGPAIAKQDLGGAGAWAALVAAQGVGGLIGGLFVLGRRVGQPVVGANLAWSLLFIPNLLMAFVAPLPVLVAGGLAGGAGLTVGQALWDTALQRHVPGASLSRVSSYDWFGSLLFNPLGFVVVGPIAAAIGSRATLTIAAVWFVASSLALVSLPSVRAVRNE